jgi:UDP-N-acetylglucosamine 4,6-dehydratase
MNGVHLVVHAAAMKRVEACEADPWEATLTNVIGTHHVASAAILAGVHNAVFLSTDKAPAAHTLYGATKFTAERLWIASNVYAAGHATKLSATRYGNVLGSRGSVLGIFKGQRDRNLPLTISCENATRFWMTIDQAVDLVLLAFREMKGGEVFIPKVGSAIVLDLARAVVGPGLYEPGHVETGLGPGERMHETLISSEESRTTYDAGTHYIIEPESATWRLPNTANGTRPWWESPPSMPCYPSVPADFSYRSDTNPMQLSVDELRELVA